MYRAIAWSLIGMLTIAFVSWRDAGIASAQENVGIDHLLNLPEGWSVTNSVPAFSREIGNRLVRITNTTLITSDKHPLQVNTISCENEEDAAKVQEVLARGKAGVQARCPREGKLVFELVGEMKMVERANLELGFKPQRVTYDVSFQATPIAKCEPMAWNKMFNAFLATEPSEIAIRNLSKSFTFGDRIYLRNHGLGSEQSAFIFGTKPTDTALEADGEITNRTFANLPSKYGVPQVKVSAVITSEAFAITPSRHKAGRELLEATEFWPSADEEIVALAKQITGQGTSASDKLAALLAWFSSAENFKFDSRIVGSRYGVKTAIKQHYGMCWDYSDCFVTLCRASGVPCRQDYGWLYPSEGHIWAEVLIEGKGWRQVDPQAGAGCDSRYVPLAASETGAMPMVYTSAVRVVPSDQER